MSHIFPFTPDTLDTPPEAAHGVMASWLMGCSAANNVPYLRPQHFSDPTDAAAWAIMLALEKKDVVGDQGAFKERLRKLSLLQGPEALMYFKLLLESTEHANSGSMCEHGRNIFDYWRRRQMLKEGKQLQDQALDPFHELAPDLAMEAVDDPSEREPRSLGDILDTEYPESTGPVPGLIPNGLTVLGSRPKVGKSTMLLQLAGALGNGGSFLAQQLELTKILYYALEDNEKRIKERAADMGFTRTTQVFIKNDLKPLNKGGFEEIANRAKDYGGVFIDTVTAALPGKDLVKDGYIFGECLSKLQKLGLSLYIPVVTSMHIRKPNGMSRDPIDDIMGHTGMTAPADMVMALYRDQDNRFTMIGRGRDIPDLSLTMTKDPVTRFWQSLGNTDELAKTENESKILETLKELGNVKAADVAEHLGMARSHTSARLQKMLARGLVSKQMVDGTPHYFLSGSQPGSVGN